MCKPHWAYVVDEKPLKTLDSFADLRVISSASSYDSYFRKVITKTSRLAELIRKCFKVSNNRLLRPAFQY